MSNQQRIIYINGKQAVASINELIERADKLRQEIGKAEVGSAAFIKKSLEVSKVDDQVQKLTITQQKLIDKYGTLAQIEARQAELQKKLTAGQFENDAELHKATKEVGDLAQAWQKLNTIQNGSPANEVSKQISAVRTQANALGTSFTQLAGYAALAFSVSSVVAFGTEVLKVASDFEQTAIAYEVMLGSKEKADKLQAQLIDLAAKTPFELPQIQQATKSLLAFGFSAEEVIPNLTNLGNIAAGVGQDKLPQLILAFGQVRAATRLTGNELRQFTEAGVPLMEELAKQLKKPVAEIKKMVEEGEIGFPLVQKALASLTTEGGRFATLMQRQSQTLGGVWSTFKDNFTQGVMLPLGNFLSRIIQPVLSGFLSLGNSLDSLTPKMDALRKRTENEQKELNFLVEKVTLYTKGSKERESAINDLQKLYPDFLKNMDKEKVSNEELRGKLQEVNKQYKAKRLLIESNRAVEEYMNKKQAATDNVAEKDVTYTKQLVRAREIVKYYGDDIDVLKQKLKSASDVFKGAYKDNDAQLYLQFINKASKEQVEAETKLSNINQGLVKSKIEETKVNAELIKQNPGMKEAFKEIEDALNATGTTTGKISAPGLSKKDESEINSERKKIENITEIRKKFENDILSITESEYKDEIAITEKYQKEIDEFQKLTTSKDIDVRRKATHFITELETLKYKELTALNTKKLTEIQTELEKQLNEANLAQLTAEQQEEERIAIKYEKQITSARRIEQDTQYATEDERTKAHALRLNLEAARQREIDDIREKSRAEAARKAAEQLVKDEEATKQFLENMKKLEESYQTLLRETKTSGPIVKQDSPEALEQNKAEVDTKADQELAALNAKFDKEIIAQKGYDDRIIELNKKREDAITAIKAKANEDKRKLDESYLTKSIQNYQALAGHIGDAFVSLGNIIGNEAERGASIQKVAALAQIAFNTATAISGVVSAAASTSITPIDLAIKIAAGIATVLANIATAKKVINEAPPVKQKYDGRYTTVTGERDGKQYTPQYIGAPETGMLPNSPVLFQSATGTPILASEKGREYLVNNQALKIPEVDWHVRAIDNIVKYGKTRQFFTGGDTSTATQKPVYQSANTTEATPQSNADMGQLLAVLQKLDNKLDKGIEAYFSYGTARDLKNAIERITKIEGK